MFHQQLLSSLLKLLQTTSCYHQFNEICHHSSRMCDLFLESAVFSYHMFIDHTFNILCATNKSKSFGFDWHENEPVQSNQHQAPVSQHRFQPLAREEKSPK